MTLSPAQLQTLKTWLDANASGLDDEAAANALNAVSAPDYFAWRTKVTRKEILENGFDWTRLDNLSVGKARIWSDIFVDGAINPSKSNVRSGIEAVWVGTAPDLAVRAVVYGHCRRPVTVAELLYVAATAGGAGQRGSTANPDTLGAEGVVTAQNVGEARNLT